MMRCRLFAAAVFALPTSAWAAGGAHLTDDSEIAGSGSCQVESWVTRHDGRGLQASLAPSCVIGGRTAVEVSGTVTSVRSSGNLTTIASLGLKLPVRPVGAGAGVAIAGSTNWNLGARAIDSVSLTVPVTAVASDAVRISVNGGWIWSAQGDRHAALAAGQIESRLDARLVLMAEAFARDRGKIGYQAGLRWTASQRIDLDLVAGRYIDGDSPGSISLGFTVRG